MINLNRKYAFCTSILFFIEVLIALYVHDNFIRPYIGDLLVVILIYCFCKSFTKLPSKPLAIGVLLFAYTIETLQYFQITKWLGLSHYKLANIIIGTSFSWEDILCYTVGIAIVLFFEKKAS
jgi:hypothetical protein